MPGLRSARGRVFLASAVLVLLLASVAALALWRTRADARRHDLLGSASASVSALERAHRLFNDQQVSVAALMWAQEPMLTDAYRLAAQEVEQQLSLARDEALAAGDTKHAAAIGDLMERIAQVDREIDQYIPILANSDLEQAVQIAVAGFARVMPAVEEITADFDQLVQERQARLAAELAAANRAVNVTLWLLVGSSGVALVGGALTLWALVLSVLHPLASLQKSARAVTAGNLRSKAAVSGPDEVASLARAFNEMVTAQGRAEEARGEAHDQLEVRVQERTADLARANERLGQEITERKRVEETLRESEERYRDLVENISEVIYALDEKGCVTYVSPVVEQIGGFSPSEVIGRSFTEFIHPDDLPSLIESYKRTVSGHLEPSEYRVFTKSGEVRWVRTSSRPVFEGDRIVGLRAVLMDITDRRLAQNQIEYLAFHDGLTGLPNRALLTDRLTMALAERRRDGQALAVMFLDLDRFKLVNDTVGHAAGDQVLQGVAERLTGTVREGDTVARLGGDEFTVLLPAVSRMEEACEAAKRILQRLRWPWVLAGHEFHITASLGIAIYPQDGEDAETILRNADTAMYRAKDQGRDNFQIFTTAMNAHVQERVQLESELRQALKRGEFEVYYQPEVNTETGQIVAMEALVRWHHPERGLLLPEEFIPLAEETGLILALGEWVLRTACAQNRAFQEASLPHVRVAVNLSSRQFQDAGLVSMVARLLKETGLDPHYLELEITEGTAMRDVEFTIKMLSDLRGMGVHVSIDDFGTGYSSLAYMKRLPVDSVKIDGSFVSDAPKDPDDAAIVAAIVALARTLNLRAVAEGVETYEQLAVLREQRCHEAQGYLFSKPVPAQAIERILSMRRPLRVTPKSRPGSRKAA